MEEVFAALQDKNKDPKQILDTLQGLIPQLKGKDINTPNQAGDTLLHIAVEKSYGDIVRYLLIQGANPNCQNLMGETPLHIALQDKDKDPKQILDTLQSLISQRKGKGINTPNQAGDTLLHIAVGKGYGDIVEYLLNQGANPSCQNVMGETPLHIVLQDKSKNPKRILNTLQGLISHLKEKNIDTCNDAGNTILHFAVEKDYCEIAEYLLNQGANPNPQNLMGETPLHIAADNGRAKAVEILLQNPTIRVDIADNQRATPLLRAVKNEHSGCVSYLVKAGADIYVEDNSHTSPYLEIFTKNRIFIELLLANLSPSKKSSIHGPLEQLKPVSPENIKEFTDAFPILAKSVIGSSTNLLPSSSSSSPSNNSSPTSSFSSNNTLSSLSYPSSSSSPSSFSPSLVSSLDSSLSTSLCSSPVEAYQPALSELLVQQKQLTHALYLLRWLTKEQMNSQAAIKLACLKKEYNQHTFSPFSGESVENALENYLKNAGNPDGTVEGTPFSLIEWILLQKRDKNQFTILLKNGVSLAPLEGHCNFSDEESQTFLAERQSQSEFLYGIKKAIEPDALYIRASFERLQQHHRHKFQLLVNRRFCLNNNLIEPLIISFTDVPLNKEKLSECLKNSPSFATEELIYQLCAGYNLQAKNQPAVFKVEYVSQVILGLLTKLTPDQLVGILIKLFDNFEVQHRVVAVYIIMELLHWDIHFNLTMANAIWVKALEEFLNLSFDNELKRSLIQCFVLHNNLANSLYGKYLHLTRLTGDYLYCKSLSQWEDEILKIKPKRKNLEESVSRTAKELRILTITHYQRLTPEEFKNSKNGVTIKQLSTTFNQLVYRISLIILNSRLPLNSIKFFIDVAFELARSKDEMGADIHSMHAIRTALNSQQIDSLMKNISLDKEYLLKLGELKKLFEFWGGNYKGARMLQLISPSPLPAFSFLEKDLVFIYDGNQSLIDRAEMTGEKLINILILLKKIGSCQCELQSNLAYLVHHKPIQPDKEGNIRYLEKPEESTASKSKKKKKSRNIFGGTIKNSMLKIGSPEKSDKAESLDENLLTEKLAAHLTIASKESLPDAPPFPTTDVKVTINPLFNNEKASLIISRRSLGKPTPLKTSRSEPSSIAKQFPLSPPFTRDILRSESSSEIRKRKKRFKKHFPAPTDSSS